MVVEDADKQNNIKEYTMQFTQEMMLHSDSGYCMPFEERNGDVQMSLGYGKQKHPQTGETFFNHGVDFKVNNYLLSAVATGKVTGLGNDAIHGIYQVTRYGDYEVIYSHLSNVFANYGKEVKAGQVIAVSGRSLHIEVKYKGEELNPLEFLTMIYSNLKVMEQHGRPGAAPQFVTLDMDVRTAYDKDQEEIENLMMRFFPDYMTDMSKGIYVLPEHTELALRNIFTMSAMKHYFFETIPSMANPLGMGAKSIPIAERVQNLLIADFLNYLALRHQIFLSSMSAVEKKKAQDRAIATSGLVDYMWMWEAIDIEFLGAYGYECPDDIQRAIEGMSFSETAVYFKERFDLPLSLDEIKAVWTRMSIDKYRHEVPLKPGVLEFLKYCKENGIRT